MSFKCQCTYGRVGEGAGEGASWTGARQDSTPRESRSRAHFWWSLDSGPPPLDDGLHECLGCLLGRDRFGPGTPGDLLRMSSGRVQCSTLPRQRSRDLQALRAGEHHAAGWCARGIAPCSLLLPASEYNLGSNERKNGRSKKAAEPGP